MSGLRARILDYLARHPEGCDSLELAIVFEANKTKVSWVLGDLYRKRRLERSGDKRPFKYTLPPGVGVEPLPAVETEPREKPPVVVEAPCRHYRELARQAAELAHAFEAIDSQSNGRAPSAIQMALELVYEGDVWLMVGKRKE